MIDMHGSVRRNLRDELTKDLTIFPAVVLLGPRQVGKSTLAKELGSAIPGSLYLDLESPADLRKLTDPELFLDFQKEHLVIIDEVQTKPELFPILRSVIDRYRRPGRFLLLGSASQTLVNRSAESLAGRVGYWELTPFWPDECAPDMTSLFRYLVRGGFPESFLAADDQVSLRWRQAFLRSTIERDLPLLGLKTPVPLLSRLLLMVAHEQGQTLNSSKLAQSLGMGPQNIRFALDFLEQALLVRLLKPWEGNLKKRLVKAPKVYLRDVGLVSSLLDIQDREALMGHPGWGAIWESAVVEACLAAWPQAQASFFRTSNGAEVDLVLEGSGARIIVEAKASTSPSLTKGFWIAVDDLKPTETWVCAPVTEAYPLKPTVWVLPIQEVQARLYRLSQVR